MKKTWKVAIYWGLFILFILVGEGIVCYEVYDKIKIKAYSLFEEVVEMDIDMRIKKERVVVKRVKRETHPVDTTSVCTSDGRYTQKKEFASKASYKYNLLQHYLSDSVPIQVSVIDSLFQAVLQQADIPAEVAVKSVGKDFYSNSKNVVMYSKDISRDFLYVALPVKKMEIPACDYAVCLQGFIKCPFDYLLKKSVSLVYFRIFILISLGVLCWLISYTIRLCVKKKALISPVENVGLVDQSEPERIVESETVDVIKPLQPTTREWLSVTDKILLDETTGDIKFDGEIVLRLKGLNLKLFVCFVKNINVGVGFVQLKNDVWNNSDTNNSTISIQVKKLEKKLQEKIPVISIENIHGEGYCLTVSE